MNLIKEMCSIENSFVTLKVPIEEYNFDGIVTCNKSMMEQIALLERIANKDVNILINGETGTGKEVYAEYIHKISSRSRKRFVKLNCSTIPDTLFESEMFGYTNGAFTGASKFGKKGLFELADEGTIFLDEIGEMPLETQSKLLRVIQEKCFIKIGSEHEINVDVKIVSATNKNLKNLVKENKFREDLFYRLNVFPINLIPLRNRKEDIVLLSFFFLNLYNAKYGYSKKFGCKSLCNFIEYDWPGNVRELKNTIERAMLLSIDDIIVNANPEQSKNEFNDDEYKKIDVSLSNIKRITNDTLLSDKSLKDLVDDYEIGLINYYIEKKGSLRNAAKALRTSPATLSRKLSLYKQKSK